MKESDNNVKLIVLDRLIKLKENPAHEKVLQVCMTSSFLHKNNIFSVYLRCQKRVSLSARTVLEILGNDDFL